MARIIYNDLGGPKDPIAAAVATLSHFEDDLIGLARVVPYGNSLVPVGIEGQTRIFDGLDAVAVEQLTHLLQRHRHALIQGLGGNGSLGSQGTFEIVENGQQVADECFLFRGGLLVGISLAALYEIVKVSGEAEVIIPLRGQLFLEYGRVRRRGIPDWKGRTLYIGRRAWRFAIDSRPAVALHAKVSFLIPVLDDVTSSRLPLNGRLFMVSIWGVAGLGPPLVYRWLLPLEDGASAAAVMAAVLEELDMLQ